MKRIITFLFIMQLMFVNVYASTNNEYTIDSYDVEIIVNEDNTFDITEKIETYFYIPKHGIFRKLPMRNSISRLDGTTSKNYAKITNVEVDNKYSISSENGYKIIKIGDENEIVTGYQDYVIKYTYNIGNDPLKDKDELYYNLIGTEWDTSIRDVTFKIVMPKSFDKNELGFSVGRSGSTDSYGVDYSVNGNTITGSYSGVLDIGEGLTVRLELPEGYFVKQEIDKSAYLTMVIPVLFAAIAIFLWYRYGRDEQVVETVEFYPPENYNSLDIAFMYNGSAINKDVTSLLIYLANKGYIKISEYEEKVLFSTKKSFRITKVKDYDGNDKCEELFFNGLFTKKKNIFNVNNNEEIDSVTANDLYDNFYITTGRILGLVNAKENKNKIFDKVASSKRWIVMLMMIVAFVLMTLKPVIEYSGLSLLPFALIFPAFGFTAIFCSFFTKNLFGRVFLIVWGLGFGGVPFCIFVLPALMVSPVYLIGYIIGIVSIIIIALCYKFLMKRTQYGNQILGKIRGFKNFLETAEKDQLESMVLKSPTYFYDILPYTYVLGVSSKWISKFESINMQAPNWYDGSNSFNVVTFGSFIENTMNEANSTMNTSSSSSSSGGGSSGGGSGGGGGGSW